VSPSVSIVIPTWNEAANLPATLAAVSSMAVSTELIVVDGGSTDNTVAIAKSAGAKVIVSELGRGLQLQAGAMAARGEVLWFLHADTVPPADAVDGILTAIADPTVSGGNFSLRFSGVGSSTLLTAIYPRLRLLGLCYGDSGIFVRRSICEEIGGIKPYPIFEDVDLVRRIKRTGRFVHLPCEVVTSSRRFEGRSFTLTFALWTAMQVLFWMGVSPKILNRAYRPLRSPGRRAAVQPR
jgi:rSAM/selenodomain-associated transferase 2